MSDALEREVAVFNAARRLPPEERATYLNASCAGDPGLRQRVEELLQASDEAGGFLQEPAPGAERPAESAPPNAEQRVVGPAEKPGDRIGRYKLLQQIGEGGCGVVYMAEQEEPVRRKVALKVIKLGMDTRQVIARFEAERQALALMDHPNIAKVLDGGSTDTGRPFFVMELVRGVKVTDYCDEHNVSTRERLGLFIQTCQAIQHAHQKGVIHRDIKPSNILVTINDGLAVPKVIDFGIAKATQGRLTDQTLFTAFEQFIGTPSYMSPEQAVMTSLDIDTRSDVYSLGVLLYELLTGCTPFDAQKLLASGLEEMRRTIRETEPLRPSTRLSTMVEGELTSTAKRRQIEPLKLIHLIRGDLDWIVMKSLEKDRTRRYETSNGLASDVQRYLADEPVVARPPGKLYRFQKLVRRNKLVFAATTAVAAVLVLGLSLSTWLLLREKQARAQAASALKTAETALNSESRFRRQAQTNEQKARKEAAKSQQVAQLLKDMLNIGPSAALGRDTTMLQEILAKAADRFGRELKDQPEVEAELRFIVSGTYLGLGKYVEAEAMARDALAINLRQFGPENPQAAWLCGNLANALSGQERLAEAETVAREGLRMWRTLPGDNTNGVAQSLSNLALLLLRQSRTSQNEDSRLARLNQAEQMAREAVDLLKRPGKDSLELSTSLGSLALILQGQARMADAEDLLRDALAMQIRCLGDDNLSVAMWLLNLGEILSDQGKQKEAEPMLRQGLALRRKFCGNDHVDVAYALGHLAVCLQRQGRLTEAEQANREALRVNEKAFGHAHPHTLETMNQLAEVLRDQGKLAEAETTFREVLAIPRNLTGDDNSEKPVAFEGLVKVLLLQKKYAEAEAIARERNPGDAALFASLGESCARLGHFAEAAADYAKVIQLRPEEHENWFCLAPLLAQVPKLDAYREHCRKSLEHFGKTKDPIIAERTAKFCLILPSSGVDPETLSKLADFALSAGTNHSAIQWFRNAKGLAEYRCGHFRSAVEWTQQVLSDPGTDFNVYRDAEACMVLAMSQHQLKQTDQARATLAKGIDIVQKNLSTLESGDLDDWKNWIITHLLMDEAKALIEGASAIPNERLSALPSGSP